jgi:hypothetical protein
MRSGPAEVGLASAPAEPGSIVGPDWFCAKDISADDRIAADIVEFPTLDSSDGKLDEAATALGLYEPSRGRRLLSVSGRS